MMPEGLHDPCVTMTQHDPLSKPMLPVKISDVRPIFPSQGFQSGQGKVGLFGLLTEHGTLTSLKIVNASARFAHYESSARAATSLWRFQPAIVNGCPVVSGFSVTVGYSIQ